MCGQTLLFIVIANCAINPLSDGSSAELLTHISIQYIQYSTSSTYVFSLVGSADGVIGSVPRSVDGVNDRPVGV